MQVVYPRCCGLDVHKKLIVACLLVRGERGGLHKAVRTFGTTTDEILRLGEWLHAAGCTAVAMESSGVYWQPVYNLLEGCGVHKPHLATRVSTRTGRAPGVGCG